MKSWNILLLAGLTMTPMGNWAAGQATKISKDSVTTMSGQVEMPGGKVIRLTSASAKMEKAAYLGVTASPVNAALREQLNLKKGIGLVVDRVEDDSPAAAAGIKQYDILQKLDDQWLVDSYQFATLLHLDLAGQKVSLTVIHQGQSSTVTATLIEKEVPVLEDVMSPKSVYSALTIPSGANTIKLGTGGGADVYTQVDSIVKRLNADKFSISSNDGTNEMSYAMDGEHSSLKVTGADGKTLFDGPVDTTVQRRAIPPDLMGSVKGFLARIDAMHIRPRSATRKTGD